MCRDDDLLRELICLHPAHGENAKNEAVAETPLKNGKRVLNPPQRKRHPRLRQRLSPDRLPCLRFGSR